MTLTRQTHRAAGQRMLTEAVTRAINHVFVTESPAIKGLGGHDGRRGGTYNLKQSHVVQERQP